MLVETYEMKKGLNILKNAVGTKSPIDAMKCVLLEADENGLFATATNGQVSIRTKIGGEIKADAEEKMLIQYNYFHDIVSSAATPTIELTLDKSVVKLSSGTSHFKLNTFKVKDFPNVDLEEDGEAMSLKTLDLLSYIEKTIFATSAKDYGRAILKGVNFTSDGKELTIVATDSYRLSQIKLPFEANKFNVTIPGETLKMMKTVFGEAESVDLTINSKKAVFKTEDTILSTALLEGGYPDVERLIPYNFKTYITFNRGELISCLNRASMIKNDNIPIVKIDVTDSIAVSSKNSELGEFNDVVNASVDGEPFKMAFSASYILDALKALNTDEVKFCFQGEMKPFTIVNVEEDGGAGNVLELALPVKTYN